MTWFVLLCEGTPFSRDNPKGHGGLSSKHRSIPAAANAQPGEELLQTAQQKELNSIQLLWNEGLCESPLLYLISWWSHIIHHNHGFIFFLLLCSHASSFLLTFFPTWKQILFSRYWWVFFSSFFFYVVASLAELHFLHVLLRRFIHPSSALSLLIRNHPHSWLLHPALCVLTLIPFFFSLSMIYFQSVSLGSSCVWTVVLAAVLTCVLKASLCTCQQKHAFNSQRPTEPDQQAEHRAHITADVEGFSWFSLKNLPNKNPQCRQGQPEEHPTELINQSVREPALDGPAGGVNEWGLINSNTFL